MTGLTIGRAGSGVTTRFTDPERIDLNGNSLTMSGTLRASSQTNVLLMRQQLNGLVDSPDEPVVPIIHSGDATINGFYRVESISVQSPDHGTMQAAGALKWSGQFERIAGYGAPTIETIATMPLLSNHHGVTGAEISAVTADDVWFPGVLREISHVYGTLVSRVGDNGDTIQVPMLAQPPLVETVRWSIAATGYYSSAVSLQVGTGFDPFVGRQLENSVLSSVLDDWRIYNGLVRVSWDTADQTLVVQHYDGTTWETAKKYRFWLGGIGNNQIDDLVAVRVLSNSPDRVTVRIACTSSDDQGTLLSADLTVLRGERMVRIAFASQNVVVWGIARATNEASTATSSTAPFSQAAGVRANANDADGNQFIVASAVTVTPNNTVGGISTDASHQSAQFMISSAIAGSSAVTVDTPDRQILSFLAGTNQQQIVSVR